MRGSVNIDYSSVVDSIIEWKKANLEPHPTTPAWQYNRPNYNQESVAEYPHYRFQHTGDTTRWTQHRKDPYPAI